MDDSEAFVTEVCLHYFGNEMTQSEIATQMGVTRLRVNQAIQHAKTNGIIKFQIDTPFIVRFEKQQRLKDALGLKRTCIAPVNENDYSYHRATGAALASFMNERLREKAWKSIGVSWGITLDFAIQNLTKQAHPLLEIVSILGGTAQGSSFNSFGIASGFADILGAYYSLLMAPIYLEEAINRDLFLSQSSIEEHFEKFKTLDAVLLTCSNVTEKSFLISNGLPPELPRQLIEAGAVGDVLGRFLDKNGDPVLPEIDGRIIGMPLEEVKNIPEKVMAAAGEHKISIILAACQKGFVDTLITDEPTADLLLTEINKRMGDRPSNNR